jgi:L-arabinokinase
MPRIAYYIDSHGFGHATRSMALMEAFPCSWEIFIRTNAPEWLFRKELSRSYTLSPSDLDIHPYHSSGYCIDTGATAIHARDRLKRAKDLTAKEAAWLKENRIDAVLADIPPVAIHAAHRAGIPCFGISNFTWDWIFEPLLGEEARSDILGPLADMMAEATLNFLLPFSDRTTFPSGFVESPLLVRAPRKTREQARQDLNLRTGTRYILLTFGGIQNHLSDLHRLEEFAPLQFVQVQRGPVSIEEKRGVRLERHPSIQNLWLMHASHLYHPDLILAVDGVVTKPGYGILSECMATSTPIVLDSREDFREFQAVLELEKEYPQVAVLRKGQLECFEIGESIERVLGCQPIPWRGGVDGDRFIAERIADFL